ncbi:zinc ribbon domain-containing protein [Streptomyces sp. NPDC058279]|uniref:zinc ribbon domain-containing protein n=1 Tax=Streptomyces sp. NPDC058279 TaxID=3346418 RepID=UPI0036F0C94C
MAKTIHDAGWSSFVRMLEYKAARYGRTLVRVERFEPTSQVCSRCGVKDGPKPLHVPPLAVPGMRDVAGPGHQRGGQTPPKPHDLRYRPVERGQDRDLSLHSAKKRKPTETVSRP